MTDIAQLIVTLRKKRTEWYRIMARHAIYQDTDLLDAIQGAADELEKLDRRVVALEQAISEEIDPEFCSCGANSMLVASAQDAHFRRRSRLSSPNSTQEPKP